MTPRTWNCGPLCLLPLLALAGCGTSTPPDEGAARLRAGYYEDFTREKVAGYQDAPSLLKAVAEAHYKPAYRDYFADMDMVAGPGGKLERLRLGREEVKGRNAWVIWSGGNEAFWDWVARHSYGSLDLLKLIDSKDRRDRFGRAGLISEPGMEAPGDDESGDKHTFPYGIRYDRPGKAHVEASLPEGQRPDPHVYGYPSGVVGLRLFPNPEFKGAAKARWDPEKYYKDPDYASRADTIRPFRVGMSCGFCHIAPHPLNPPADPERPKWENLSNNIGNQFMRFRAVFGGQLKPDNFMYHVLDAQLPGTIDTSLVASDNINNPNTVNSFYGLPARLERARHNPPETVGTDTLAFLRNPDHRLRFAEGKDFENPHRVPRVLLDGSDSVGVYLALARVYLNIGQYHQQWVRLHNTFLGFRTQAPFKVKDCEENSVYWHATKLRVEPMAKFFVKSTGAQRLKDAPDGLKHGKMKGTGASWDPGYEEGRKVYASACIACHSSIQPGDSPDLEVAIKDGVEPGLGERPKDWDKLDDAAKRKHTAPRERLRLRMGDLERLTRGDGTLPPAYARWAEAAVEQGPLFWENNYLSTDQRIPVTLARTNSQRAMATNGLHKNMWEDFASETYKSLDGVGRIRYRDPFSGAERSFDAPGGGRGYYRVPTLISVWATAPFLHNNALGVFNNKTTVEGRLEAFKDAARRLLWPETRAVPTKQHYWAGEDKEPAEADNAAAAQLANDGGWVWRTTAESRLLFRNHQIPTFLAGLTGWSPFWVAVSPWLPSIVFVVLGTLLLLSGRVRAFHERLESGPILGGVFFTARMLLALAAAALLVVSFYLVWKFQIAFEVLDAATEGSIYWLTAQAYLVPAAFFGAFIVLLSARQLPDKGWWRRFVLYAGAACYIAAVVIGFSFGWFLAGMGNGVQFGPIPKGVPVNIVANLDPDASPAKRRAALLALASFVLEQKRAPGSEREQREAFEQRVAPALLDASKCPDIVTDRGHDYEFLRRLSDAQKNALIELLKTF